jgi:hypothetical protein
MSDGMLHWKEMDERINFFDLFLGIYFSFNQNVSKNKNVKIQNE